MVTICINGSRRMLEEADESWVHQQINRRWADGQSVCVQVTVRSGCLDMILSTPTCAGGFGGGRAPNGHERDVFALWERRSLNCHEFTGLDVVAFLKQLVGFL